MAIIKGPLDQMNSHALAVSSWFFASPLGKGERTKVRACTLRNSISRTPHPALSLEKGEANIALTT